MLYHVTWLITKIDPIKYLFEALALSRRIAMWQVLLSKYDIIYVSQKAIKGSAIIEFLLSRALDDYQPLDFEFPDQDLMNITIKKKSSKGSTSKMYFNGASNALGHRINIILISPKRDYYLFIARIIFDYTNSGRIWGMYYRASSNVRKEGPSIESLRRFNLGNLPTTWRMGNTRPKIVAI